MGEAATTNLHLHRGAILNVQIQKAILYHAPRSRLQETSMASSRLAIFALLATALITLLQVFYQGKPESPFETRPLTMVLAVISLFIYCLSYDAKLRSRLISTTTPSSSGHGASESLPTARFVHVSMAVFGPLSLAAMASVLFPKCSLFLFPGAVFYSFCQIQQLPAGIRKGLDWLLVAIKNRFCLQDRPQDQSTTVQAPWISQFGIIDHVEIDILPPV